MPLPTHRERGARERGREEAGGIKIKKGKQNRNFKMDQNSATLIPA